MLWNRHSTTLIWCLLNLQHRVNGIWMSATYHSDSQLQAQGSPADNQGKHPEQAHPMGGQTDGRCSSSDFKQFLSQDVLFGVQSNYQTQEIINLWLYAQINNPSYFRCHGQQQPEHIQSSYPALGYCITCPRAAAEGRSREAKYCPISSRETKDTKTQRWL